MWAFNDPAVEVWDEVLAEFYAQRLREAGFGA